MFQDSTNFRGNLRLRVIALPAAAEIPKLLSMLAGHAGRRPSVGRARRPLAETTFHSPSCRSFVIVSPLFVVSWKQLVDPARLTRASMSDMRVAPSVAYGRE